MNNILQLKGTFQTRSNRPGFGTINIPKGSNVTVEHLEELVNQLDNILLFWGRDDRIKGALVSVHYNTIVAKSNRLKTLLAKGSKSPSESICGAKFDWSPGENSKIKQKHIFTHFVDLIEIKDSIHKLKSSIEIIRKKYGNQITYGDIEQINQGTFDNEELRKKVFIETVVDSYYVERFDVDKQTKPIEDSSIITIYKTGVDTISLLSGFGVDMINAKMIDETTLRLNPDEIKRIQESAPYLIAMSVKDFAEITKEDIYGIESDETTISIPDPQDEPTVGVIDTHFDERVYFHKWVQYENKLSSDFEINEEDCVHGTAVSSIIVDGPSFNPNLDDGCGRFQVKHFGVATAGRFSSFTVLKLIKSIVSENRDIKVWNLSLGSSMEINSNFISPEAAELDKIQSEYDVVFIIAGTNKPSFHKSKMRIGAPADSLNALVVNSVDFKENSASYTRTGPVLSFFHKPDVSYYGGDGKDKIIVCEPAGRAYVIGTSFAAPWITRKMAFLIHIMGLSREVAKALIIDSAAKWKRMDDDSWKVGYGIVPKNIKDVLYSRSDEIRFILSGKIDDYETYTYNIPVPQNMNAHPYFAKATLVYFPKSNRNQGVDYTSTEMDIHFGRIDDKTGNIKSINSNKQADEGINVIYEKDARKMYRKWDNVKHISEKINERARPRKTYGAGMWGLSIKTKERTSLKEGRGLQFGVVVTLREMNGVNRIDDFIKMCIVKGWIVNRIDLNNQLDIYNVAEQEIDLQ